MPTVIVRHTFFDYALLSLKYKARLGRAYSESCLDLVSDCNDAVKPGTNVERSECSTSDIYADVGRALGETPSGVSECRSETSPHEQSHALSAFEVWAGDAWCELCPEECARAATADELRDIAMLEPGEPAQCLAITVFPTLDVIQLSCAQFGSRQIQLALEQAEPATRAAMVRQFEGHWWKVMESPHGNFVVQKCIELFKGESQFIIVELMNWGPGSATHLAKHRFGCRVFQRILEHCSDEQKKPLVEALLGLRTVELCKGIFSNYVMQKILEVGTELQRSWLVRIVAQNVQALALHDHAASVVGQALVCNSSEDQRVLASALLVLAENSQWLVQMARHKHASLTIQRLLRLNLPGQSRWRHLVAANTAALRGHGVGRHVLWCLEPNCHPRE